MPATDEPQAVVPRFPPPPPYRPDPELIGTLDRDNSQPPREDRSR